MSCLRLPIRVMTAPRMTYRRRQTPDANLADWRLQTERLAAVRSVRLVRQSKSHKLKNLWSLALGKNTAAIGRILCRQCNRERRQTHEKKSTPSDRKSVV